MIGQVVYITKAIRTKMSKAKYLFCSSKSVYLENKVESISVCKP